MPSEISLADWSASKDVPYSTALQWVKNGRLKAQRKKKKIAVLVSKSVRGYFLMSDTKVPD